MYLRLLLLVTMILPAAAGNQLDEILANHYRARGGLDRLRGMEALTVRGTATWREEKTGFSIQVSRGWCRFELQMAGTTVIKIFDKQRGWQINPVLGTREPKPMNAEDLNAMVGFLDLASPLVDWQAKGHRLSYLGSKQFDGHQVHEIQVVQARGGTTVYVLDGETYLARAVREDGLERRVLRHLQADGLTFVGAFAMSKPCDHPRHQHGECGLAKVIEIQEIRVNPDLEPDLFDIEMAYLQEGQ